MQVSTWCYNKKGTQYKLVVVYSCVLAFLSFCFIVSHSSAIFLQLIEFKLFLGCKNIKNTDTVTVFISIILVNISK